MLNAVSMKIKTPVRPTPALQGKKERNKRERKSNFQNRATVLYTSGNLFRFIERGCWSKKGIFWKEWRDKNLFNQISRIGPILSRFFIPISPSDNSSQILKSTSDVQ